MSLWVDKYRPKSLDSLDYHEGLSRTLKSLAGSKDFPHILMYGPSGAGKKTRVLSVLRELYGPGVEKIKINSRTFVAGSRKIEFTIVSSANHMEITPSEMGNNDRVVIQDLLKEVAQTQQINIGSKQRFKVVVINEADSLTRDAQSALRRTMEKYTPNLRLILLANSTSNIMAPIRSRTLLIRVAAPTISEISIVLSKVAKKERVELPKSQQEQEQVFSKIGQESVRNLRKALLMFEAMYAQNERLSVNTPVPPADWEVVIDQLAKDIVKEHTVSKLVQIRTTYYELISHCIPPPVIIKALTFKLLAYLPPELNSKVVECAALYDHRIRIGSKAIFHLEAFTAKVMGIIESN